MGLIDKESFRKRFFELNVEFRPSQIDAVFDCLNNSELVDAEQVIRCKDCHWHYGTICRRNNTMFWEDEDFCSLAEREDK